MKNNRRTILGVAARHFARYGFSKTTIEDIAKDSHLTKPTIYNYFNGKSELFEAVINEEHKEYEKFVSQSVSRAKTVSDRIRIYSRIRNDYMYKLHNLNELSQAILLNLHPDVFKIYKYYQRKEEQMLAAWINEGIENGEFESTVNPKQAARLLYFSGAILKLEIILGDRTDLEVNSNKVLKKLNRDSELMAELFLNGLLRRE